MAEARGQSSSTWNDAEAKMLPEKIAEMKLNGVHPENTGKRKRVVIVGLGMVGIAFMSVKLNRYLHDTDQNSVKNS